MSNLLKIGVVLGGLFLLTRRSVESIVNGLKVKGGKLLSSNLSGGKWNINLQVKISNENSIPIILDSFAGQLTAGDNHLSSINLTQPITIPSNSDIDIPFNVSVPLLQLVGSILTQIQAGGLPSNLKIIGTANSGGVTYPVEFNVLGS